MLVSASSASSQLSKNSDGFHRNEVRAIIPLTEQVESWDFTDGDFAFLLSPFSEVPAFVGLVHGHYYYSRPYLLEVEVFPH